MTVKLVGCFVEIAVIRKAEEVVAPAREPDNNGLGYCCGM